jgi:hypothetical protein
MALAENALEPCSDADAGLFYPDTLPESRWFIGNAGALRGAVTEYLTGAFKEVDTGVDSV